MMVFVSLCLLQSAYGQINGQYKVDLGGDDYFNSIKPLGPMGYCMAGSIGLSGNFDASFLKTDGVTTMAFSYGSAATEFGTYLTTLNDGNVLITGRSNGYNGGNDFDVFLVKINPSDGSVIWSKAIGTDSTEYGFKAINAADGNILVIGPVYGNNKTDMMVLKVSNTDGHVIFARKIGFQYSNDTPYDILDMGGMAGMVVLGFSGAGLLGMNDICAVQLNNAAQIVAAMFYGGTGDEEGRVIKIAEPNHNYAYIAGTTGSFGAGSNDFYVVKLNTAMGMPSVVWCKTYGSSGSDNLTSLEPNQQGFLLGGITSGFGTNGEGLLVQVDTTGEVIWSKHEGSGGDDYFQGIMPDTLNNTNYIIGYSNSFDGASNDGFLVVADAAGESGTCDGNAGIVAQTHVIGDTIQSGTTVLAQDTLVVAETDAAITATALTAAISQVCASGIGIVDGFTFTVQPNPFSEKIFVENKSSVLSELEIYDINSKLVYTSKLNNGVNGINLTEIPAGVYIMVLKNSETILRTKILKYN